MLIIIDYLISEMYIVIDHFISQMFIIIDPCRLLHFPDVYNYRSMQSNCLPLIQRHGSRVAMTPTLGFGHCGVSVAKVTKAEVKHT